MNAPRPPMVTLTERAVDRVKHLISQSDDPVMGLRIGVSSRGCSGLSYSVEYANEPKAFEEVIEQEIEAEVQNWSSFFIGQMQLKAKIIRVEPNPFEDMELVENSLCVLRIEAYPLFSYDNHFSIKIQKKGV